MPWRPEVSGGNADIHENTEVVSPCLPFATRKVHASCRITRRMLRPPLQNYANGNGVGRHIKTHALYFFTAELSQEGSLRATLPRRATAATGADTARRRSC